MLSPPGRGGSQRPVECVFLILTNSQPCVVGPKKAENRVASPAGVPPNLKACAHPKIGAMISQLFILAPNGHTIVHKDYRGEVAKDAPEVFLRKVVEKTETSPIFQASGSVLPDHTYIRHRKPRAPPQTMCACPAAGYSGPSLP